MVNHDRYKSIKNVFKRDPDTGKRDAGEFSRTEFEYLRNCQWIWTEKLDGMNVRVILDGGAEFRGRGNGAKMPGPLMKRLRNEFDTEEVLARTNEYGEGLCLYGEGVGAGIQRGNRYGEQFFVMFDAMTDYGWASRHEMLDIAARLGILTAPVVLVGTVAEAIKKVRWGLRSEYGPFFAEGLVGRPCLELRDRYKQRIITKIKHRDFYRDLHMEGLT